MKIRQTFRVQHRRVRSPQAVRQARATHSGLRPLCRYRTPPCLRCFSKKPEQSRRHLAAVRAPVQGVLQPSQLPAEFRTQQISPYSSFSMPPFRPMKSKAAPFVACPICTVFATPNRLAAIPAPNARSPKARCRRPSKMPSRPLVAGGLDRLLAARALLVRSRDVLPEIGVGPVGSSDLEHRAPFTAAGTVRSPDLLPPFRLLADPLPKSFVLEGARANSFEGQPF